ncbi:MAG: dTDP-4-dehydrorhamnose reductase [Sneathiella sp.]|uniref:dTDP-4-dehydrorhamnose reductase n=1 Tax=Sneathiella sp. TaxID=1964365 RepID=UPI003002D796
MKLVVTGAGGQVGAALGLMGPLAGHEIIPLDRQTLDIADKAQVIAAISNYRPDAVINAAAYTAVDKAESEPDAALAINAAGAENLAIACAQLDIPFLHISTDFVFDGTKEGPYTETDPIGPLSVYGSSKAEGEARVKAIGGKFLILRTAWVFGGEQNFVATMLRLGETLDELQIVDDQHGGPTACTDIAATLLRMAEQALSPAFSDWGFYHYSGAPSLTWYGFAQAIFSGRDKPVLHPIPTEDYPTPAARPKNSVLDCSKIKQVFDIDQPDWRTALSQLLT